jgi:probable phosphoglycerate mutase
VTLKQPPKSPEPPFSVRRPFLLHEEEGLTRLTMVRHAQQDYPVGDDYDPKQWDDPPLSGLGTTQAMAVSATLAENYEVDVVACSTMSRAIETAKIIAAPHGLEPIIRPELVEVQTFNQLEHGVDPRALIGPDEWAEREKRFTRFVKWDEMPFGEGSVEFRQRAVGAIEQLVEDFEGQSVVLVSHGGVINAYLGWILGVEEDMFFLPNHCSITTVWAKGEIRRVHSVNERQHLHIGILTN